MSKLQYRVKKFSWNPFLGMYIELVSYRVIESLSHSFDRYVIQFGLEEERLVYCEHLPVFGTEYSSSGTLSKLEKLCELVKDTFNKIFLTKPYGKFSFPSHLEIRSSEDEPHHTIFLKDFFYEIKTSGLEALIRKDREELDLIIADFKNSLPASSKLIEEEVYDNAGVIKIRESDRTIKKLEKHMGKNDSMDLISNIKDYIRQYFYEKMPRECTFNVEDLLTEDLRKQFLINSRFEKQHE